MAKVEAIVTEPVFKLELSLSEMQVVFAAMGAVYGEYEIGNRTVSEISSNIFDKIELSFECHNIRQVLIAETGTKVKYLK